MKEITIKMSKKLYDRIIDIKNQLSFNESQNVNIDDMIEESLMSYFNINIIDLNNDDYIEFIDADIIDTINNNKLKNNFYVYVYYNLRKKINKYINNIYFEYEPIYVGKGIDNRMYEIENRDQNLKLKIEELKSTNQFKIEKIIENLSECDAINYEMIFINNFGKLNDGSGCLFNKQNGYTKNQKIIDYENYNLNIEYNLIKNIVNELNKEKYISKASKNLNMSERTLHRKIIKYNIKKDKKTKIWYIDK